MPWHTYRMPKISKPDKTRMKAVELQDLCYCWQNEAGDPGVLKNSPQLVKNLIIFLPHDPSDQASSCLPRQPKFCIYCAQVFMAAWFMIAKCKSKMTSCRRMGNEHRYRLLMWYCSKIKEKWTIHAQKVTVEPPVYINECKKPTWEGSTLWESAINLWCSGVGKTICRLKKDNGSSRQWPQLRQTTQ